MKGSLRSLARRLPEVTLWSAGLIAVLRLTAPGTNQAAGLASWLPFDPASLDPLDAALGSAALIAVAFAVHRRKQLARPLAVAMFGAAFFAQTAVMPHPFGAAVALACLAVLLLDGRSYRTLTDPRKRDVAVGIMVGGVALLVGAAVVSPGMAASAVTTLPQAATWPATILGFVDATGPWAAGQSGQVIEGLELLIVAAVVVAALLLLAADPDRPSASVQDRARSSARQHVRGALAPFQVGPDALLFTGPEGDGVVAYGRAGRTAIVLGDPIGPEHAAWSAFEAFEERCAAGGVAVAVYQVSQEGIAQLAGRGYRHFRVGQEAVIDLRRWDLGGSRRANLRHTVARAARGGIRVTWHAEGLDTRAFEAWVDDLVEIDRAWQTSHGPAMRFTMSRFDVNELREVGVAVATDESGRVNAFATFRRTDPDSWVLDLMRRRGDAVPGALEACIATAATEMRATATAQLSLGLVALAGLTCSSGPIEERILAAGRRLAGRGYDIEGLLFFKQKFDPDWRPRHGAIRDRLALYRFAVTLLRLHFGLCTRSPLSAGLADRTLQPLPVGAR